MLYRNNNFSQKKWFFLFHKATERFKQLNFKFYDYFSRLLAKRSKRWGSGSCLEYTYIPLFRYNWIHNFKEKFWLTLFEIISLFAVVELFWIGFLHCLLDCVFLLSHLFVLVQDYVLYLTFFPAIYFYISYWDPFIGCQHQKK